METQPNYRFELGQKVVSKPPHHRRAYGEVTARHPGTPGPGYTVRFDDGCVDLMEEALDPFFEDQAAETRRAEGRAAEKACQEEERAAEKTRRAEGRAAEKTRQEDERAAENTRRAEGRAAEEARRVQGRAEEKTRQADERAAENTRREEA